MNYKIIGRVLFILIVFSGYTLKAQQTERIYLSGTGSDHTVEWDFYCTGGQNSEKWTKIPVPSNWEQHGFGEYNYGYDKAEGRASEQGLYKHTFLIPKSLESKKINIVFDGAMTDTEVKINGKLVGSIHQGAFYRFKYDVSEFLKFGEENVLEVKVSKVSANESVNKAERNADYWIFGGIYRPVYLEVLPVTHIEQLILDAASNGVFKAEIYLKEADKKDIVTAQITDLNGNKVSELLTVKTQGENKLSIKTEITQAKLWSPEFPNLYNVCFVLSRKGIPIHVVNKKIGFRTIELREKDGIYLNEVKIKFKGVNRHSFYPTTGRALCRKNSIDDVLLIKQMNMNAVRNSHYPADDHFYEVCDSMGILVLDELGGWHDAYDTEVGAKLVKEMMYKSINHPSVVMWVNGNEGGHNPELVYLYDSIDIQKRPVVQAWEIFRALDTQHYRDYNYGIGSHYQGHNVVMPTEFLHGMYDGGSGSGLEDFWELMWNNPLSAGGFLWDFSDEAIVRMDMDSVLDSDGNHGADGVLGPYREKEGSFYTIKEVWAPIYFSRKEITSAFDGRLNIENRYHFTNLNQCSFKWELAKYPLPNTLLKVEKIAGDAVAPSIVPEDRGILELSLPKNWEEYDVLAVSAFNPQREELFTWNWPISRPEKISKQIIETEGEFEFNISEEDSVLVVKAGEVEARFSKNTGLILGVENAEGKISLSNGPILCEGESKFKELIFYQEGNVLIVESVFEEKSVFQKLKWTIFKSGWMRLDVAYASVIERHDLLGINFSYPEEMVKSIQWMGDGPYRVWKNRMKGNHLGVWEKDYNNTITGVGECVYPEFKGFHSRMYWLRVLTKEQNFTVVCPDEDLFFRMYTPETPEDPYNTAPVFPAGDISFLHGISPMGTKCLHDFRMGPMSAKNIYYSFGGDRPLKMVLYFNFLSGQE